MPSKKTPPETFSQKEIAEALNNAVVLSLKPKAGPIPPERLRKIRPYALAVVEPCMEHVGEGLIRPEEMVVALVTAALFVQLQHVMGTQKLPMRGTAEDMFGQARRDLEEFNRKSRD